MAQATREVKSGKGPGLDRSVAAMAVARARSPADCPKGDGPQAASGIGSIVTWARP